MPEYKGFQIREGDDGETDKYVINEPFYNHLVTSPDDIVLDIGAHIGTFVRRVADKVAEVYAFEPDPTNFSLLEQNTGDLHNVLLVNKAIVGDESEEVEFWLGNPSIHSTVKYRGRKSIKVAAANFHRVLYHFEPSLLKIDIEGGEYDFWGDLTALPSFVKRIAIEIHLNRTNWRLQGPELVKSFEDQGFHWLLKPRFTKSGWTTNVIGERD